MRVNSTYSDLRNVCSGVPQGGVLSPLLFNIYVAEIASFIKLDGVKCEQHADDLKIYREIRREIRM